MFSKDGMHSLLFGTDRVVSSLCLHAENGNDFSRSIPTIAEEIWPAIADHGHALAFEVLPDFRFELVHPGLIS